MNILIIHNAYRQFGGEDAVVRNEVKFLRERNHDVRLYVADNSELAANIRQNSVEFFRSSTGTHFEAISGILSSRVYDIVHVHNTFPLIGLSAHFSARAFDVPLVQTIHNYRQGCIAGTLMRGARVCEKCVQQSDLFGILYRCYRRSTALSIAATYALRRNRVADVQNIMTKRYICLTEFARQKNIEFGLDSKKIRVRPNFCEPNQGAQGSGSRSGALFVGRLSAEKGIMDLISAWPANPDCELTVAGDGPLKNEIQSAIRSRENIRLLGQQSFQAVQDLMESAAVLIVPSNWYEGFPMVIVEAFARGLPVIAPNLGSMAEIIVPHINGWLYAPFDHGDLGKTISQFFASYPKINGIHDAVAEHYRTKYHPTIVMDQLEAIYEEVISER